MLAPPPKPSNTIISGRAANGRAPEESIRLLVAEVIRICEEMEADIRDDVHPSDAEAEKLSARLDRLEKKIAKSRAATVEELKAKAQAVNRLSEFAIESIITDSIIRDLVMSDSPCARAPTN
jgi:leucyl-tRNA synthetase